MTDCLEMLVFPNGDSIDAKALVGIIVDHKSSLLGMWEFQGQDGANHTVHVYAAVFERAFGDYLCIATSGGAVVGAPDYRGTGYVTYRLMEAFFEKYNIDVCTEGQNDPTRLPSETEMRTVISSSLAAHMINRQSDATRGIITTIEDDVVKDIQQEKLAGD